MLIFKSDNAHARIKGGRQYPSINGTVDFKETKDGVLLNRFRIRDIIWKTIITHDKPDDFTGQPSGNSGNKIACGVIK